MKYISMILLCFVFINANAQEETTEPLKGKNGQLILPETSEIGLGFNAIPLLNWFGNSFNNNSNNTYAGFNKFFSNFGTSVVMGKYMLDSKTAIRANFGFNFSSVYEERYIQDDASNDPMDMVVDSRTSDNGTYVLSGGYEMRRGKGRIQGYYGGDLALMYSQSSGFSYTYGNGYSATNVVPSSTNWGSNINSNERTVSVDGNNAFGVGLRPFIGLEYFVAPKVSVGGEFGYSLFLMHSFESTSVNEYFEASTGNTVNTVNKVGGTTSFSGGVDNFNGSIFMMFYF